MWLRRAQPRDGNRRDAAAWDQWWGDRISKGGWGAFPLLETPLNRFWPRLSNVVNNDDLLVHFMNEYGLHTVLCAGNGTSQEPRALAAAGFDVTALDISPVAVRFAATYDNPARLGYFCSPQL